jgi:hypothetical protein
LSIAATPQEERHDRPSTSAREVYAVRIHDDERSNIYGNFLTPLDDVRNTIAKLRKMLDWPEDWNGHGAAKPSTPAILKASHWIIHMRADAGSTEAPWLRPYVVPDQDGDIVFEWSNGERTLSVYVSPDAVEYLKVWGADIHSQMEDDVMRTREDNRSLWLWLMEQA